MELSPECGGEREADLKVVRVELESDEMSISAGRRGFWSKKLLKCTPHGVILITNSVRLT